MDFPGNRGVNISRLPDNKLGGSAVQRANFASLRSATPSRTYAIEKRS